VDTLASLFRFKSLKTAFLASVLPLILLIVAGTMTFHGFEMFDAERSALLRKKDRILRSQSIILARAAYARDEVQVTLQIAPILTDPDVAGIFVYTADQRPIASFGTTSPREGNAIRGDEPIRYALQGGLETVGRIELVLTDARLQAAFESYVFTTIALSLALTLALVIAVRLGFTLTIERPLTRLLEAIDRTRQGAVRETVPWHRDDEIGRVIKAFNALQERQASYEAALDEARATLERRVEERTAELTEARDEAQTASKAKSAFLANMSHELRTPLNSILGFAGIIKSERFGPHADPRYKAYADIIAASGDHLLELINDLLDLSKAEAGNLVLEEVPVSIQDQAERAVEMVQDLAQQGNVRVQNSVDPALPAIRADTRMVRQVLSNLLSNAIKFTPKGGRVTLSSVLEDDGGVTVMIRDTGIGIPANKLTEVVRPFTQVESSLSRHHRGTGLGLPLCKSILEQHGGSLVLESELDRGTSVKARFPAERVIGGPTAPTTERVAAPGP